MEKDDDALLMEADTNDPLYVALRASMVAEARLDCVEKATNTGYHDIECDPNNEEEKPLLSSCQLVIVPRTM